MSQNKGAVIEDNNYDNEISEFFEEKNNGQFYLAFPGFNWLIWFDLFDPSILYTHEKYFWLKKYIQCISERTAQWAYIVHFQGIKLL